MDYSNPPLSRRRALATLGTATGIAVAGCIGDDAAADESGNNAVTEDVEWPPPRGIIELAHDSTVGSLTDTLPRLWQPYFDDHLDEDISLAVASQPEAAGVIMANRIYNDAAPHGGEMGLSRALTLTANQIGRDDAEYDTTDFRHVVQFSADTRGLQMNPETMPVDDHFDITWEEFQEYATSQDDPLIQPVVNPAHASLGLYLYGNDPVIELGEDIEIVFFDGGSEARAAMQRGEADLYFGTYASNISTRNDFYFTQFSMVNPEASPEFYESIATVTPEFSPEFGDNPEEKVLENYVDQAAIVNVDGYPEDIAEKVVDLVADFYTAFLPPETPDEVYETHAEAWKAAGESDELAEEVTGTFAEPDHNPLAGQAVQEKVENKYETLTGDDEIRELIEEELF